MFPSCKFKFRTEPRVYLGRQIAGVLEVEAGEDIRRAEVVFVTYVVTATAEYTKGDGKTGRVRRELAKMLVRHDLPPGGLARGTHTFPFAFDPPPGLPPTFEGSGCSVVHLMEARVDVDWAVDPVGVISLEMFAPPVEGARSPFVTRTPPAFHPDVVLEISLASSVIIEGEPIHGHIALRSGAQRVDRILIDARRAVGLPTRPRYERIITLGIPRQALEAGTPVSFTIPPDPRSTVSFAGHPVSSRIELVVAADIPWAADPRTLLALHVVPRGSVLHGGGEIAPVGAARLRQSARVMAEHTGLPEGQVPVLVEGAVGPVWLRVSDAPHGAQMGVRAHYTFPDVELGLAFGARGWLGGGSSGLPPALARSYVLELEPEEGAPPTPPEAAAAFVGELADGLEGAASVHLGDAHLTAHFTLLDDDGARMSALATFFRHKAERIGRALASLPPPAWMSAAAVDAWRAAATEVRGSFIASGPKLCRVPISARLFGGVDVAILADVRTEYRKAGPARTVVDVDLSSLRLPEGVDQTTSVGSSAATMATIRETFPEVVVSHARATLARPSATEDPRALMSALGELLSWVIEVRGLKREAAAPYR